MIREESARLGRRVVAAGAMPVVLIAILAVVRPAALANLERASYDVVVRHAATGPSSGRVVIVDVDERSLAALGQWPWRRGVIGTLVSRIRQGGAAAVALDMVFAEPGRSPSPPSPQTVRLTQGGGGETIDADDEALATALRDGGTALGYVLTFDGTQANAGCVMHPAAVSIVQPPSERGGFPLFHATGAICTLPRLALATGASGFLNAAPDADGVLRRVPLLIELDGRVYPSLALASVTMARPTGQIGLRVANVNTTTLVLGERTVPLDGRSQLLLHYYGRKGSFRFVSVADVMEGRLPTDTFQNKVVFVGATALGTREVVVTPFDTQVTGVEVQATVADNLLQQNPLSRPEHAITIEVLTLLATGLMGAWLFGRAGLAWSGAYVLVSLTILWEGSIRLVSTGGVFLSPVFSSLGLLLAFVASTAAKFTTERRRANQAGDDKARAQQMMIQTLLSLTEVRDLDTGRHSRRIRRYTGLLAQRLSGHPSFRDYLTEDRILLLMELSQLHDIGKVGVPDRLLHKPGPLTPDEFAEMRKHPGHGLQVLMRAEQRVGSFDDAIMAMAKQVVYTHHEHWDGTGYPEGLSGTDIPIPGRVIAVVDTYDALITRRVYREAYSHEAAVDLILKGRGTLFEPAVVNAFLDVAAAFEDAAHATET